MNATVILAGVIALLLLCYLFISLIKPEWFG
jgi:K+-transporting ATPase KdpF subunit